MRKNHWARMAGFSIGLTLCLGELSLASLISTGSNGKIIVQGQGNTKSGKTIISVTNQSSNVTQIQITLPQGVTLSTAGITGGTGGAVTTGTTDPTTHATTYTIPLSGGSNGAKLTINTTAPISNKTTVPVNISYKSGTSSSFSPSNEQANASLPSSGLPGIAVGGSAVTYSSTTEGLTFSGDTSVTDTGFTGDPLDGASLVMPSYQLLGLSTDGLDEIFSATDLSSDFLQIQNGSGALLDVLAPFLFYDIADNTFSTELNGLTLAGAPAGTAFYDPSLASLTSPGLEDLQNELNPGNAVFFGDIPLGISFTPGANFEAITSGFANSGSAAFSGSMFVTAPEPGAAWLMLVGAAFILHKRSRWRSGPHV